MKRHSRRIVLALVILGIAAAGIYWWAARSGSGEAAVYRTDQVKRGELLITIGATGTLQPEEVINVGAQIAGQILSFGIDANKKTIDYGSMVAEGMVLAQIDPSLYQSEAAQASAQVQAAAAGVQRAEADLEQMRAKLDQAGRDWERARQLGPSEALAQVSYDAYRAAFETARANVAVGEAAILQARANRAQAEAALTKARRNLGYCTIKSPVKGVIIDRRVNIGQTVVASLNAPSLFLIAKDLKRMQLWVAVNEADIGKIHPGQAVTFTVDAFPGERFQGTVGKARLNASMTQNVVTYTVEVLTDNSDGRLLPYLTANVQFEISRQREALLAANAALRYVPAPEAIDPRFREPTPPAAGRERRPTAESGKSGSEPRNGTLWTWQGSLLKPIRVRMGQSDGVVTAVEGEELAEGTEIVLGQQVSASAGGDTTNPFTPKIPRGRARGR